MDTPELTPPSAPYSPAAVASLAAASARASQQTKPPPASQPSSQPATPPPQKTCTMADARLQRVPSTAFLDRSLRPLSPPDSPFNFNGAFDAGPPHPAATTDRAALATPSQKGGTGPAVPEARRPNPNPNPNPNPWERALARKAQDNPYFPSIAEQERNERWTRERAVVLQASPPEDVDEDAPGDVPSQGEDDEVVASDSRGASPAQRKRSMKIRLPASTGGSEWPARPASLDPSPSPAEEEKASPSPASLEAYTRGMREHLQEGLRRKMGERASWGGA